MNNLADERTYTIYPTGDYDERSLYFCYELTGLVPEGTASSREADAAAGKATGEIAGKETIPIKREAIKNKMPLSANKNKPQEFSYELTDRFAIITGHFARCIVTRLNGAAFAEFWVALDITPSAFLNQNKITKKAKDIILCRGATDPKIKRYLNRLLVKTVTNTPNYSSVSVVKKIRYGTPPKDFFKIPQGYKKK